MHRIEEGLPAKRDQVETSHRRLRTSSANAVVGLRAKRPTSAIGRNSSVPLSTDSPPTAAIAMPSYSRPRAMPFPVASKRVTSPTDWSVLEHVAAGAQERGAITTWLPPLRTASSQTETRLPWGCPGGDLRRPRVDLRKFVRLVLGTPHSAGPGHPGCGSTATTSSWRSNRFSITCGSGGTAPGAPGTNSWPSADQGKKPPAFGAGGSTGNVGCGGRI
jgi:hypothetical protein